MQHLALGRLPDQLLEGRGQVFRDRTDDVPLGRGWQRNLQVPLQAFEAIEGKPAAIFEEADHAAGRGIILLTPCFSRCGSREHLAAQVATQLVQLIDVRRQRRLPDDPHHHAGPLVVDRAIAAGGTGIAGLERRMPHVDPRGALVSVGAVAPMARGGRFAIVLVVAGVVGGRFVRRGLGLFGGRILGSGLGLARCVRRHGLGLFRAGAKKELTQPPYRSVLVFHHFGHVGVRLKDRPNQLGVLLV